MTPILITLALVALLYWFIDWVITKHVIPNADDNFIDEPNLKTYRSLRLIVLVATGIFFVFQSYSYFTSIDNSPPKANAYKVIVPPKKEFVPSTELTRDEKAAKMKAEAEETKKAALEHYDNIEPLKK